MHAVMCGRATRKYGVCVASIGLVNPLTRSQDDADRLRLRTLFPELHARPNAPFLAMRPYLEKVPARFFNRTVHRLMLNWLRDRDSRQRVELRRYLRSLDAELNSAMLFLRQVNAEGWHDRSLVRGDEYEVVRFIDTILTLRTSGLLRLFWRR